MLDIAREITKIRKELNLTQIQFAKLIGIKQPYLSKIESGKNVPTLETLIEIFTNLGYIMNVTVTKEENTVENKKSYPTSETVTLVFRDEGIVDSVQTNCYLYYRTYKYTDICHEYTLIKDRRFTSFLEYLENTLSISIPTKTPKKVILYFSSEKSVCTLRFYTNSNQYKSSNYIDIDLEPVFFSDTDTSHGLSMVKFSTEKELLEEKVEEVKTPEKLEEDLDTIVLKQYYRHLDKICEEDKNYSLSAYSLSNRLDGIFQLFYDLLGLTMKDIKWDYFERYTSFK